MAVTVNSNCRPTDVGSNIWCVKDLFALGEGTDIIGIPTPTWNATKKRWLNTKNGAEAEAVNILVPVAGASLMEFVYNQPTTTPQDVLFPTADVVTDSLYFTGNALIFNPTVGNSTEANGVPYQNSTITLPVGSNKDYDGLIQYIQSKAWTFLKLNNDNSIIHAYGGPRGYFPVADEVAEMMYSGNNDSKGETQISLAVDKANYSIEYLELSKSAADPDAMVKLMGYIKEAICKPNGVIVG